SAATASERHPIFSVIDRDRSLLLAVLIACEIARARIETRRNRGRRRSPITDLCLGRAIGVVITQDQIDAGDDQQYRTQSVEAIREPKVPHCKGADADEQGAE